MPDFLILALRGSRSSPSEQKGQLWPEEERRRGRDSAVSEGEGRSDARLIREERSIEAARRERADPWLRGRKTRKRKGQRGC